MSTIDSFFKDFYNENYSKAYRYANSLVFDKETARDLASDAMLRIWEMRTEIDPERNLCSLLFVTVRNKCMDYLRHETVKYKAHQQTSASAELNHLHEFVLESTVLSDYYTQELTQLMNRSMDSMQETTRNCFQMVRLEGKSYQEVADVLNITTRSVEYELKKATTKMQLLLGDYVCA